MNAGCLLLAGDWKVGFPSLARLFTVGNFQHKVLRGRPWSGEGIWCKQWKELFSGTWFPVSHEKPSNLVFEFAIISRFGQVVLKHSTFFFVRRRLHPAIRLQHRNFALYWKYVFIGNFQVTLKVLKNNASFFLCFVFGLFHVRFVPFTACSHMFARQFRSGIVCEDSKYCCLCLHPKHIWTLHRTNHFCV